MMTMSNNCFFIGSSYLPEQGYSCLIHRIDNQIDHLMDLGVSCFFTGGLPGFDALAAQRVRQRQKMRPNVRLYLVISGVEQAKAWYGKDRAMLNTLASQANGVVDLGRRWPASDYDATAYRLLHSQWCLCLDQPPNPQIAYWIKQADRFGHTIIVI